MAKLPEDGLTSQRGYRVRTTGPLWRKTVGLPPASPPVAKINTSAEPVEELDRSAPAGSDSQKDIVADLWPTADLIAALTVAACRQVGADPLKMMRHFDAHGHPARVYVFHAIKREFPALDVDAIARLTGIKFGSWGIIGRKLAKFGPTSERVKYGIWNMRAEQAVDAALRAFRAAATE